MALDGKHVLVTGGGTGIGAATAQSFAHAGASVTIASRNLDRLQKFASTSDNISAISLDVTDAGHVADVFAGLGDVDILINNAGAALTAPFHKMSEEIWSQMLRVNLTGTFLCTQAALAPMKAKNWGRIVNIASTAAHKGYAYTSAYCAAKHGVVGMTKALALELAGTGITANCVCPGFTDTQIVADAIENITTKTGRSAEEALGELVKGNPQKRLIEPEEVANAVLWLCRDESRSITGHSINVAGGEVM